MCVGIDRVTPEFLRVKPGDIVIVEDDLELRHKNIDKWWMGQVLHVVGGARDPCVNSIFQVADIDTGEIKYINADLVRRIFIEGNNNE